MYKCIYFKIRNIFVAVLASILLSITNFIVEQILDNLVGKAKKHG